MQLEQSLTFMIAFSFKTCTWETGAGFSKCETWVSIADALGNDAYKLMVLLFLNEVEYTYEEGVG